VVQRREVFYTPEQVAEILNVKVSSIRRWLRDGKLEGVQIGRMWRVSHSQLEEFMNFEFDTWINKTVD
jgi:excisionase family DNA binding protein